MIAEVQMDGATTSGGQGPDDPDGSVARLRWRHLPDPVAPHDWTTTQPVEHGPHPEQDHQLAHLLLLGGAG